MAPISVPAPRLTLWPKRVAYAVYVCVAFVLGMRWGLQRMPLFILVAGPPVMLDLILRPLVNGQLKTFDRQLMASLQAGEQGKLLPLYQAQRLLRFACPSYDLLPKLGLIYSKLGEHQAAIAAFRDALEEAPRGRGQLLSHQLADALYAAKDFEQAEAYYRASQDENSINAGVRARIARLTLERGGDAEEAEQFMRQAVESAKGQTSGGRFRCQLVMMLVENNKLEDAQWHLALAEEELKDCNLEGEAELKKARQALSDAKAES